MIFVGDLSLGIAPGIKVDYPESLADKHWIINLEGSLVKNTESFFSKKLVVNDYTVVKDFCDGIDISFCLANNHILDNNKIEETITNLKELNYDYFGAGCDIDEARKPLLIYNDGDVEFVILGFGWNVIECKLAGKNKPGVNPLNEDNVLSEINYYRNLYHDAKIVAYFHWDYELEKFPMPNQRMLSFRAIDAGCDCIIGTHPHRIQGLEIYKGKPIVYSLGNWAFQQEVFVSGKLKFPDFCLDEMAFEYCKSGNHKCHFFRYNKADNSVKYMRTDEYNASAYLENLTPFKGMTNFEYNEWFKINRHHKNFIPVYNAGETVLTTRVKDFINSVRTLGINTLVKVGLK